MSVRTLQRRLADEGTTYSALLDRARHELAVRFIGEQRMPVKEATFVLGFSRSRRIFSRAFKRWTGVSPTGVPAGGLIAVCPHHVSAEQFVFRRCHRRYGTGKGQTPMKEPEGQSSSAAIADGSAQPAFVRGEFEALTSTHQAADSRPGGTGGAPADRAACGRPSAGRRCPGLAKTRAVKALASGLEGDFHRIQFTPDLLPADLTGTEIYRPQDGSFRFDRAGVP